MLLTVNTTCWTNRSHLSFYNYDSYHIYNLLLEYL